MVKSGFQLHISPKNQVNPSSGLGGVPEYTETQMGSHYYNKYNAQMSKLKKAGEKSMKRNINYKLEFHVLKYLESGE